MPEPFTTTCIRLRADTLRKLKALAEMKRLQTGGRASVSALLGDLAEAEHSRVVAAQAKRRKVADA